jgi:hypothetical protein
MKHVVKKLISIVVIVVFIFTATPFVLPVQAAVLTSFEDNLTRLQTSTLADHIIKFVTPTGVGPGQNITLTFDSDFTMGSFALNNFDLSVASTCNGVFLDRSLGVNPPIAPNWRVTQSGNVVTFANDNTAVSAGQCIKIEIGSNATFGGAGTTQITNPSGAQTATLVIGGTFGDSGTAGIAIVTGDQVNITATVDPTISFAVTDSTIGFGTLGAGGARWANGAGTGSGSEVSAHDITAATNATSGYTIYVLGATLTSGINTITEIGGSAVASSPGSEQFGLKVAAAGGSGAAVSPYASADYAYNATTVQDDIATSTVPSTTTTFSITYLANISATTEAGSYATTLTYTATGLF